MIKSATAIKAKIKNKATAINWVRGNLISYVTCYKLL